MSKQENNKPVPYLFKVYYILLADETGQVLHKEELVRPQKVYNGKEVNIKYTLTIEGGTLL